VTLEQAKDGNCTALGPRIPVTPGTAFGAALPLYGREREPQHRVVVEWRIGIHGRIDCHGQLVRPRRPGCG